jgi:hypothetical protein
MCVEMVERREGKSNSCNVFYLHSTQRQDRHAMQRKKFKRKVNKQQENSTKMEGKKKMDK